MCVYSCIYAIKKKYKDIYIYIYIYIVQSYVGKNLLTFNEYFFLIILTKYLLNVNIYLFGIRIIICHFFKFNKYLFNVSKCSVSTIQTNIYEHLVLSFFNI